MKIITLIGFGWCQEESYLATVLIRICEAEMDAKVVGAPTNSGRGRPFAKGNAGRKPGAKNRTTLVAEALLRDEERSEVGNSLPPMGIYPRRCTLTAMLNDLVSAIRSQ
jgi:hypothetical protein